MGLWQAASGQECVPRAARLERSLQGVSCVAVLAASQRYPITGLRPAMGLLLSGRGRGCGRGGPATYPHNLGGHLPKRGRAFLFRSSARSWVAAPFWSRGEGWLGGTVPLEVLPLVVTTISG
jgi:hypothetical protein